METTLNPQIITMEKINEIFIRRANKLIIARPGMADIGVPADTNELAVVSSFLKNIEDLGFTFSRDVVTEIFKMNEYGKVNFYREVIATLQKLVGADVEFNPMYPNFPKQVMEASDAELYFNAIIHYFGDAIGVRLLKSFEEEYRSPLLEQTELRVIDLGHISEFHELFINLMRSKTSISSQDKKDLDFYFREFKDNIYLPDEIPHKEVLTFITSLAMTYEISTEKFTKLYRSATDVLRLAVALSQGDISLAEDTNFISFNRETRRFLLSLVEQSEANIAEDMLKHKMKWIRFGEIIHPGDYSDRYPRTYSAITKIRDDVKIETFNSKVEELIRQEEFVELAGFLRKRPGMFARRLDHIIRLSSNQELIIKNFADVADKVSTPVLLQVMNHFRHRQDQMDIRIFMPKGSVAKMQVVPNDLPDIPREYTDLLVKVCEQALINNYMKLDELGKVFVDPSLRNYNIPFSQRSASESMRTLVRGSRFDIPEGSTLRFFVWWKDLEPGVLKTRNNILSSARGSRVDLDLSAVMFDEDWNYVEHISYTNLRSARYQAYHSGDITSAPSPVAEFIDIDIESLLEYGGRYVMMSVLSFTRQPFNIMPDAFAGWMIRSDVQSGEIFEPKTVQDKYNLTAEQQISIPMIFDLKERKMIWADLGSNSRPSYRNNIEGNYSRIAALSKAIVELDKANLFDLFILHAKARGELVTKPEEADYIFTDKLASELGVFEEPPEAIVGPFDIEKIMGQYL